MANQCITYVSIHNDNEEELKRLEGLIKECTNAKAQSSDYGDDWLGNIVIRGDLDTWDEDKRKFVNETRCRGRLAFIQFMNGALEIQTETAWTPMLDMWVKLLEKHSPESTLFFSAEEPGCGIFATNDPYFIGRYYIDSCRNDIEINRSATEEEVRMLIQDLCGTEETDLEELLRIFERMEIEDIWIHKWEEAEVEDYL